MISCVNMFSPHHKNETMKQMQERLEASKELYDKGLVNEMVESRKLWSGYPVLLLHMSRLFFEVANQQTYNIMQHRLSNTV